MVPTSRNSTECNAARSSRRKDRKLVRNPHQLIKHPEIPGDTANCDSHQRKYRKSHPDRSPFIMFRNRSAHAMGRPSESHWLGCHVTVMPPNTVQPEHNTNLENQYSHTHTLRVIKNFQHTTTSQYHQARGKRLDDEKKDDAAKAIPQDLGETQCRCQNVTFKPLRQKTARTPVPALQYSIPAFCDTAWNG